MEVAFESDLVPSPSCDVSHHNLLNNVVSLGCGVSSSIMLILISGWSRESLTADFPPTAFPFTQSQVACSLSPILSPPSRAVPIGRHLNINYFRHGNDRFLQIQPLLYYTAVLTSL